MTALRLLSAAAIFGAIFALSWVIARARYDRARDKAWRNHKPRPLQVHREIGEPRHAAPSTLGSRRARPGNRSNNSGSRP